ncbi:MAG: DivIVA domain-containing protein [Clostridia bacterium]|nr:DivIVA domain-containing protein [Clostridia bacterium]
MLTPLDIQNKEFKRELRGYSMQEVDEFLNLVIDGYERLYRENMSLKDSIAKQEESIKQYKNLEATLKNTLVVAQSTSEQVQKNAEEKASNIIDEANNRSNEIIRKSFDEVKKLEYRYEELKRSVDVYCAKMTALLESQLGLLKKVETSDATFWEIHGMKEALNEIDNAEKEIKSSSDKIDLPAEEKTDDIAYIGTDKDMNTDKEKNDENNSHDYDTKEIEFLINSKE